MAKNMQRRSFFSRLVGAAAVTAVAVEAKPTPVSKGTGNGTVGVRDYGSYQCVSCGSCLMGFYNHTLRCTVRECLHYDKPLRIPVTQCEVVDDYEEVIRHALIILGVLVPGEAVPPADLKLCSEVVARVERDMKNHSEHPEWVSAKDIRPHFLAMDLQPYYKFGTE